MKTLLFSIPDLSLLGETLLRIRSALRPRAIEPLYPDAKSEDMRHDYFVVLDERADVASSASKLEAVPGVAFVEVPAARRLQA